MALLLPIFVLCGICGALAALLTAARRVLTNYGVCRIRINDGAREFEVRGGESLLTVLMNHNLFVPSACGGRGSCGLCKVAVKSGGGPVLPTEEPHLTPDDLAAGHRLACQVKVREDLDIEIPEELFSIRRYRATVAELRPLTRDIRLVRLELIDPETISFKPGQYVQLEAPAYGDNPEPVYRAYSIASDPRDQHHVDLIIRLIPGGICTTWVFTILKEGDEVSFNGPYGDFYLRDNPGDAIFIAGGSGMAPFRSILADMRNRRIARKTRYYFGARSKRDLFLLEEMTAYERELPDFRFIPALSDPTPEDEWQGETGLITDVVARHHPDCSEAEAYLCGSPGMIAACIGVLTKRGMPQECIYYDNFT